MAKKPKTQEGKNESEHVGAIVARVLKNLGVNKSSGKKLKRLNQIWIEAVGEPLAGHSRVLKYQRKKLFVGVDSPAWMQEARAVDRNKIKDAFMDGEDPVYIAEVRFIIDG